MNFQVVTFSFQSRDTFILHRRELLTKQGLEIGGLRVANILTKNTRTQILPIQRGNTSAANCHTTNVEIEEGSIPFPGQALLN